MLIKKRQILPIATYLLCYLFALGTLYVVEEFPLLLQTLQSITKLSVCYVGDSIALKGDEKTLLFVISF